MREAALEGRIAVVIDVLMATTTIAYAIHHGMQRVLPAAGAEAARAAADKEPLGTCLLAGESLGETIPGFASMDPRRWDWPCVREKSLILASTNGTVGLMRAWGARELYAAALVNAGAVAEHLSARFPGEEIRIVCAGSHGQVALDDFLAAGALVHRLRSMGDWRPTDAAQAALDAYRAQEGRIAEGLSLSRTGRWMVRSGWSDLVAMAAAIDSMPVVPTRHEGWLVQAT